MGQAIEHYELMQAINNPLAARIVVEALDAIDGAYSYSGDPLQDAHAASYKPYHNGLHTRGVIRGAIRAADTLGIVGKDRLITIGSAAYHDYIDDIGVEDGGNEAASLDMWHRRMRQEGLLFTDRDFVVGRVALLGTCYELQNDTLTQHATKQAYPDKAAEAVAHAVAGADMASLHAPMGPYLAHKLYEEKTMGASGQQPNVEKMVGFQTLQLALLDGGYTYPSKTLHKLFATHTKEVTAHANATLADLQAGNIASWNDLLQRDIAFAKANS